MMGSTPDTPNDPKPLFVAPVAMRAGDEVILFFGQLAVIKRDGIEIWRDPDIPADLLEAMLDPGKPE